jgi:hypothetical protein
MTQPPEGTTSTTLEYVPARRKPRRGRRTADHSRVDQPVPLATLAEHGGLRVYRDVCGDDNVPGRWGEIYRHSPGRLAVQVGGPRANGKATATPLGANRYIREAAMDPRLTPWAEGNGEGVFLFDDVHLRWVAALIGAYKKRRGLEGRRCPK